MTSSAHDQADREAIRQAMRSSLSIRHESANDDPAIVGIGEAADRVLSALSTEGRVVARLTKELQGERNNLANLTMCWNDQCAHVLEACQMLGVDTDAVMGDSWTLREWCLRVVADRDAWRAKAEGKA